MSAPTLAPAAENLEETAPATWSRAPDTCTQGCAWYHGTWQYLRLLGLAAAPDRHDQFFLPALAMAAQVGARRVLISGSADHAMVARVVPAFRSRGVEPIVTLLDRCPTPVELGREFGARLDATVDGAVSDVLDHEPREPYDLICTHSFLSQIEPARRPSLAVAWRQMLAPGGRLVTVARLSDPPSAPVRFSAAEVADFAARARERAGQLLEPTHPHPEVLAEAAGAYARAIAVHPTRSAEEVGDLLESAGLAPEELTVRQIEGSGGSGPTTRQGATYVEVVAVRG